MSTKMTRDICKLKISIGVLLLITTTIYRGCNPLFLLASGPASIGKGLGFLSLGLSGPASIPILLGPAAVIPFDSVASDNSGNSEATIAIAIATPGGIPATGKQNKINLHEKALDTF